MSTHTHASVYWSEGCSNKVIMNRPLNSQTPFPTLASLLRITSPSQFHIPPINDRAKTYLSRMYHGGPDPFASQHPQEHLEDALELAMGFDVGAEVSAFSSSSSYYSYAFGGGGCWLICGCMI